MVYVERETQRTFPILSIKAEMQAKSGKCTILMGAADLHGLTYLNQS